MGLKHEVSVECWIRKAVCWVILNMLASCYSGANPYLCCYTLLLPVIGLRVRRLERKRQSWSNCSAVFTNYDTAFRLVFDHLCGFLSLSVRVCVCDHLLCICCLVMVTSALRLVHMHCRGITKMPLSSFVSIPFTKWLGKPRRKREDNIKVIVRETRWELTWFI